MRNENEVYSLPVSDIGEAMVYKPQKPPLVPVVEEQMQSYICATPPPPPPPPNPFKMP